MRRRKGFVCALLCMCMFLLAGCKTQSYDLSQEDQRKIADYAAHVVTKYNGKQEEGYLKVSLEEIEQEEEEEKKEEEKKEEKEEKKEEQAGAEGSTEDSNKPKQEPISLQKALKLEEGLNASYKRYEVTSSYVQESYFAMTAVGGKSYLVIHIDLEAAEENVNCDMWSKNLQFRILINGDQQVTAQTTILLNDLGTFQGEIRKGEPQDCVLLFEIESGILENIESLQLKVLDEASTSIVNLQ